MKTKLSAKNFKQKYFVAKTETLSLFWPKNGRVAKKWPRGQKAKRKTASDLVPTKRPLKEIYANLVSFEVYLKVPVS